MTLLEEIDAELQDDLPRLPPRVGDVMTVDAFAATDHGGYELVRGVVKRIGGLEEEEQVGAEEAWTSGEFFAILREFVYARQLGIVLPKETVYRCFRHSSYRKADASFIAAGRVPKPLPRGDLTIAPDLVVEVLSPHDRAYDVADKVAEYLDAGVRLIWVAQPSDRTILVRSPGRPGVLLGPGDTLDGADVLPGFSVQVADCFADPLDA